MPDVDPWHVASLLWAAWAAIWAISALRVKRARRRQSLASRLGQIFWLAIAAALCVPTHLPGRFLETAWLPRTPAILWTGTALTAAGIAFAVWARAVLGRNWSGIVTVKDDHELVRTGPYARIRHPIYSGLILALVGTAICLAEWRGLVAVAAVSVALWQKLRLEERWMVETFGARYVEYRNGTWALIPFIL